MSQLAELLGFDDGVQDVLEHLVSIESHDDLVDYLEQLLGANKNVSSFVTNVQKSKDGETLVAHSNATDSQTKKLNSAQDPPKKSAPKPQTTDPDSNKKKEPAQTKDASQNNTRKKNPPPNQKAPPTTSNASSETATCPATVALPVIPVTPQRGQATIQCGCFGSIHKALTNCLYCGRIACAKEGLGFCVFCGYQLLTDAATNNNNSEAVQHKERLLRYDRQGAQRTVIIDDQADYYNTKWMNDDERLESEAKEQQRQDALHKRGKQTLKIDF